MKDSEYEIKWILAEDMLRDYIQKYKDIPQSIVVSHFANDVRKLIDPFTQIGRLYDVVYDVAMYWLERVMAGDMIA